MLTLAQFADQQRINGHRVFQHDGIYWNEVYPFYCKPVFIHQPIARGQSHPSKMRSWLGYDHVVMNPDEGNQWRSWMVLEGENLIEFNLTRLPSKKRNQVRRGRDNCEVRRIPDLFACVERMWEISFSSARRHEIRGRALYPSRNMLKDAESWKQRLRNEMAFEGRDWWGAYVGLELVAYVRTYQIGEIMVFHQTRVDTEFIQFYPMDALYFTIIENASRSHTCSQIFNGRPMQPSLNHFKNAFLFQEVQFPCYYSAAWLSEMAKRCLPRYWRWVRSVKSGSSSKQRSHDGKKTNLQKV